MDEMKLLPCPFCGRGAAMGAIASVPPRYFVNCVMCQAVVGDTIGYCRQEDAAEAWNTRPTLVTDELVERVAIECHHASCANVPRFNPDYDRASYPWEHCSSSAKEAWRAIVRASLAAMPTLVTGQLEEGVGWQPIETAPLDGTHVLVWNGHHVVLAEAWRESDWQFAQTCSECRDDVHPAPTHWQHLPAHPQPGPSQ